MGGWGSNPVLLSARQANTLSTALSLYLTSPLVSVIFQALPEFIHAKKNCFHHFVDTLDCMVLCGRKFLVFCFKERLK